MEFDPEQLTHMFWELYLEFRGAWILKDGFMDKGMDMLNALFKCDLITSWKESQGV